MTRFQKLGVFSMCIALAVTAVVPPMLRGSTPGVGPLKAATRTPEKIFADIQALDEQMHAAMPSPSSLADPEFRKGDGQKVLPIVKKLLPLWDELYQAVKDPDDKDEIRSQRFSSAAIACMLGDKETSDKLTEMGKGKDTDALGARTALTFSSWVINSKDVAAQEKILEDFTPLVKEHPDNVRVLSTLATMSNLGPANNDVTKKVIDVIRTNAKGDAATKLLAQLDGAQEQLAMVGKPLAITGRTSTGSTFSSETYKGKVVMLDFWATWCGPCIGELPNVKKAYSDFHPKGFEIVGLSCDDEDPVLNTFTAKNDMPWIQLRETTQTERDNWHPLAKKFHVDGIPTMFLIDKKGNLRYVDAREDLRKKIELLLAEKDDAPTPAAASAPATK